MTGTANWVSSHMGCVKITPLFLRGQQSSKNILLSPKREVKLNYILCDSLLKIKKKKRSERLTFLRDKMNLATN